MRPRMAREGAVTMAARSEKRRERRRDAEWERAEARERRRHAAWLVAHGASVASVADEFGVSQDVVSKWARRYADGAL